MHLLHFLERHHRTAAASPLKRVIKVGTPTLRYCTRALHDGFFGPCDPGHMVCLLFWRTEKTMATQKSPRKRKYGEAAQKSVASALHRAKRGTLKSGSGHHPMVKDRKQAIAIGLSEARKRGAKVPRQEAG